MFKTITGIIATAAAVVSLEVACPPAAIVCGIIGAVYVLRSLASMDSE